MDVHGMICVGEREWCDDTQLAAAPFTLLLAGNRLRSIQHPELILGD